MRDVYSYAVLVQMKRDRMREKESVKERTKE